METISIVILYLIGVIVVLWIGIQSLMKEGGTVKELFSVIVLSLTSWVVVVIFLAACIQEKIENSGFWNKQIFK